jgi:HAD superfamily hydrolase (TIGR01458 family)
MTIRAVLLDIDGTLFIGPEPIPGAAETLLWLQQRDIGYRFVSNGTRKARKSVREKLGRLNILVTDDQILTPAIAAVEYLKEHGFSSCSLLATTDLAADFVQNGIGIADEAPAIVIGDAFDRFTYASVNRAFRAVMNGALLIALERDQYWKDVDGLSLGAGAFVAGIEYATGTEAVVMGKPSPAFFVMALRSLGLGPKEVMMVGDDTRSDIGGAWRAGIAGIQVMTGKYNRESLDESGIQPDLVIPSIAELPGSIDRLRMKE